MCVLQIVHMPAQPLVCFAGSLCLLCHVMKLVASLAFFGELFDGSRELSGQYTLGVGLLLGVADLALERIFARCNTFQTHEPVAVKGC